MTAATPAGGPARSRVLILTGDLIGARMAGPAIRVWNMAQALKERCDVRLVSWNRITRDPEGFEVAFVREGDDRGMREHEEWADVVIVQGTSLRIFPSIAATGKIVVADLYDPFQLEQLEQNKHSDPREWSEEVTKAVHLLNEQLSRADCFLCATERQRDLWLGSLSSLGRLNPAVYTADPTFESLVRIVPFGLPAEPPQQRSHGIKGVIPGISEDDIVLIWGGGIYNWFDPVTLVEAMALLADSHPRLKLFFLSAKHFNPDIPEMQAATDTVEAADRLGLTGRTVFFNESWVDYESRADFLLDADIGVSTHRRHAETRFSFRTRILDYLWAGLPIVTTDGDAFAELVGGRDLGAVVPPQDAAALADAIRRLADDTDGRRAVRDRVLATREEFTWARALRPLVDFCADPRPAPDRVARSSGASDAGVRFERVLAMPRGPRRDIALLRYYLREGGVTLVKEKLGKRRRRLAPK